MHHLHRDRAEPFAHAEGPDVSENCAQEAAPIEAVMVVKAAVFGRYESLLDVRRHVAQVDVDAPHHRQVANQATEFINDLATFARVERANLRRSWTARIATRVEPAIHGGHSRH